LGESTANHCGRKIDAQKRKNDQCARHRHSQPFDSPRFARIATGSSAYRSAPSEASVVTTIITYEEQMRGWMAYLSSRKSSKTEVRAYALLARQLKMFREIVVLEFTEASFQIAEQLRKQRLRLVAMDTKIASIVLANDAVLVTRNKVDFGRIKDLRTEDWSNDKTGF
jgi:tRNA(fMet)-specific endonuclease VapC